MRIIDGDALMEYCNNQKDKTIDANDIARFPTAVGWVSVKDRVPEEHPSIFASCYGTEKWTNGMWRNESDRVLVTILFPDGTRTVDKGKLQDGTWKTGVSPVLPQVVTHWAMWPEPAKEENGDRLTRRRRERGR